jgi:hypothetical protein
MIFYTEIIYSELGVIFIFTYNPELDTHYFHIGNNRNYIFYNFITATIFYVIKKPLQFMYK